MYSDLIKFLSKLSKDENISEEKRKELVEYLRVNLTRNIYFFKDTDFDRLDKILVDLDYDVDLISSFFQICYAIKNGERKIAEVKVKAVGEVESKLVVLHYREWQIVEIKPILEKTNNNY